MNATERLRLIREIYAKLPRIECKKLCQDYCGPVMMSRLEGVEIKKAGAQTERIGQVVVTTMNENMNCNALRDGQCSTYEARPLICRLFGLVKKLQCPHGCQPERYLGEQEAGDMIRQIQELGR